MKQPLSNACVVPAAVPMHIPLHEEVLQLAHNKLGPEHPNTLHVMHNLACIYGTTIASPRRSSYLRRRSGSGVSTSARSIATRSCRCATAETYRQAGRTTDAIPLHEEVLRLRREHQGPEHPDTIVSMHTLARDFNSVGRYQDATQLFEPLLALQRQTQPDSPAVAATLAQLARTLLDQDQFAAAERYARESCRSANRRCPMIGKRRYREPAGAQPGRPAEICGGRALRAQRLPGHERAGTADSGIEKLRIAGALAGLAQLYTDWGQPAAAEPYAREALHDVGAESCEAPGTRPTPRACWVSAWQASRNSRKPSRFA